MCCLYWPSHGCAKLTLQHGPWRKGLLGLAVGLGATAGVQPLASFPVSNVQGPACSFRKCGRSSRDASTTGAYYCLQLRGEWILLSGLSSMSGLWCLATLGMGVLFGSHYSQCTVRYAQKYTGACCGATEAMQIGSLCSNRARQDDCVVSRMYWAPLLSLICSLNWSITWCCGSRVRICLLRVIRVLGLKGAPSYHRWRAANKHSCSQHLLFTCLWPAALCFHYVDHLWRCS